MAMPQLKQQTGLFHSYWTYPKISFETQDSNEQVYLLLRAHPVTQITWIFATIVLAFLPLLANLFFSSFLTITQIIYLNLFWYAAVFSYAFLNFILWFFNVGIITNERVIDVTFSNIISKEVSASIISKVEDVTVKSAGFIPSIFDYGYVLIQTAGTEENIVYENIPHPTEVVSIINDLMEDQHAAGP